MWSDVNSLSGHFQRKMKNSIGNYIEEVSIPMSHFKVF